jgi:hypothetical protein
VLYYEVPGNYDPGAAPAGKQMLMTGSFCPADPAMSKKDIKAWVDAGEEILFGAFPEIKNLIEEKSFTRLKVSLMPHAMQQLPVQVANNRACANCWPMWQKQTCH